MPEQYAATDTRSGLEVAVTGEFPPHHDDRIRIARTTTLFTRLMSTILSTENETERRERFHAIVTGASDKGTWVRTLGTPVEGRVVKGFAAERRQVDHEAGGDVGEVDLERHGCFRIATSCPARGAG